MFRNFEKIFMSLKIRHFNRMPFDNCIHVFTTKILYKIVDFLLFCPQTVQYVCQFLFFALFVTK